MSMENLRKTIYKDLGLLFLFLGILFFGTNAVRPLANPDEGRYSEIPREILENGDWVSPRLNGVLYFDKPPLFYWLQAAALKVGGLNERAARFWPAAFALFGCVGVYLAGNFLFNRWIGIIASCILSTSLMFFTISQLVILDMSVSVFISFALLSFLLGVKEPSGTHRRGWFLAFYLFLALAVMTKGLIGLVIPGAIIFLWALVMNRWKKLFPCYVWLGVPLFLLVAAPWHVLAWMKHPDFAWYYFVHEHFLRYLTEAHGREQPFWFFLLFLPVGLVPWIGFLPGAMKRILIVGWKQRASRSEEIFLSIWISFVLIFFSASGSKLIPYILPVYPALALLLARYIYSISTSPKGNGLSMEIYFTGILTLVIGVSLPVFVHLVQEVLSDQGNRLIYVSSFCLCIGGVTTIYTYARHKSSSVLLVPFGTWASFLLLLNPLVGELKNDSTKSIALKLRQMEVGPNQVISLADYLQDLPFYLESQISLSGYWPRDKGFGLRIEDHSDRYLDSETFKKRWEGDKMLYAVAREEHLGKIAREFPELTGYLILTEDSHVLFSNRPTKNSISSEQPVLNLLVQKANPG